MIYTISAKCARRLGESTIFEVPESQDGPKMAPRRPQDSPKRPQDGPNQDGPKMAPRWPQEGPKIRPKTIKTLRDPQDGPKIAPRGPNMAPR